MALHRPRIAAIGVFHETNTRSPIRTDLVAFERRGLLRGPAWVAEFAGTRTVGSGFLAGGESAGLEIVGVFGAYATPSGLITEHAIDMIIAGIEQELDHAGAVDGVLLELHGALVAEGYDDAEQTIVTLLRRRLGRKPIIAVTDLHANLRTPRLPELDALIGYRTNPHVDTYDRGRDAALLLGRVLREGLTLTRAHRGLPCRAIPSAQATADPPLRLIMDRARAVEAEYGLIDVTVHAGYAYADVPHLGLGFSATAETRRAQLAHAAVTELADYAAPLIADFDRTLPTPEQAFRDALAAPGLTVITDTGDNINGGSPGDGTWLLRLALDADRRSGPAVPIIGTLWDPAAAAAAHAAGVGAMIALALGGRAGPGSGTPVRATARVKSITDGTFVNTGPMATGARVSMGDAAVITIGAVDLVLQSTPIQPNDPELFRSLGLDPSTYRIALLKGAAAVRAGWTPLTDHFIDAATPGPTA
ncbi:M81 family metallopeptidase [Microlunatus speluncae]|uniref:M81 family metallopeptidase n=1 Tax=Microlunatus speluncae TaxID=2594267 RepID=UPI00137553EA|nr:M81 family metallopeptidase [Microlunatus speluncae]